MDWTLIEAVASIKSSKLREEEPQLPNDDANNPSVDFHGERLRNETHPSRTDLKSRLMRNSKEAKLVFMGHVLMENRHGLVMDFVVSAATGTAERDAVPCCWMMRWSEASVPGCWEATRATTRDSA